MPKLRLEITKGEEIRYISHLDYARTIERAIRRAKLPAAYSEGFNPHLKMAFASALAVGVTSQAEYLDVELMEQGEAAAAVVERLALELPDGIRIKQAKYLTKPGPALMAVVNLATYKILVPLLIEADMAVVAESVRLFNVAEEVLYTKESPKGKRQINIKQYLFEDAKVVQIGNELEIFLAIKITPTGSVKPGEVLAALVAMFDLPIAKNSALIDRTGLYIAEQLARVSPIDV
jgi:radical SAM-linked protein